MEIQEIKNLFKQAEKHFSMNWLQRLFSNKNWATNSGFCRYFKEVHYIHPSVIDTYLAPYWEPYRTKNGLWAFNNRSERKKVLRLINTNLNSI